jgi:hypothetical protein
MYTRICVYIHMGSFLCLKLQICVYENINTYVLKCTVMDIDMYIYVPNDICFHLYILGEAHFKSMYKYISIFLYVYIYIHIYIYIYTIILGEAHFKSDETDVQFLMITEVILSVYVYIYICIYMYIYVYI